MPYTQSNPRIYFESAGDEAHAPLVLIEGLGAQMIGWRDEFVAKLVDHGLRVIRLDNRDVGQSEMFGTPEDLSADYAMADMASDICQVLDMLNLPSAHIVGQSMGGVIAQTLAIRHPERVRSMVLFYTAPGFLPEFLGDVFQHGTAIAPSPSLPREDAIQMFVTSQTICGSPAYASDDAWLRELGGRSFDRGFRPDGILRQMSVVMRAEDLRADLGRIAMPTAIIHGRADLLVRAEAGIEIARAVPSAELHLYPGLGHQIAQPLWDDFVTIIARTVGRA